MRSIQFTIGNPCPNGLDNDSRLRKLEEALHERFEILHGKILIAELSWWPFDLPDGTRYSLWMVWRPDERLAVHYRVSFNFEDESGEFLFGDIGVQIKVDATAERRGLVRSLLSLGLVQRGKESMQPELALRYATSPQGETSLVPISYDGKNLDLAFCAPEALGSLVHPLLMDAKKCFFWVDEAKLLTMSGQLWGSSKPFPDETLWITEGTSGFKELPGVQKFPKFPERIEVPRLGLTPIYLESATPRTMVRKGFVCGTKRVTRRCVSKKSLSLLISALAGPRISR